MIKCICNNTDDNRQITLAVIFCVNNCMLSAAELTEKRTKARNNDFSIDIRGLENFRHCELRETKQANIE